MSIDPQALDILQKFGIGLAGIIAKVLWDGVRGKMRTLRYVVSHQRIAQGADDPVFGSVAVTWKGNAVSNLSMSTVRLENSTLQDFDNLHVRIYSATSTWILSERRSIVGSTLVPIPRPEFQATLHVPDGEKPTRHQIDTYYHQREYTIPVLNRGAVAEFAFLTNQRDESAPGIWLEVQRAGVRVKERPFRALSPFVLGVSVFDAIVPGVVISALVIAASLVLIQSAALVASIAFVVGLCAQIIGAVAVRLYRRAKAALFH